MRRVLGPSSEQQCNAVCLPHNLTFGSRTHSKLGRCCESTGHNITLMPCGVFGCIYPKAGMGGGDLSVIGQHRSEPCVCNARHDGLAPGRTSCTLPFQLPPRPDQYCAAETTVAPT